MHESPPSESYCTAVTAPSPCFIQSLSLSLVRESVAFGFSDLLTSDVLSENSSIFVVSSPPFCPTTASDPARPLPDLSDPLSLFLSLCKEIPISL